MATDGVFEGAQTGAVLGGALGGVGTDVDRMVDGLETDLRRAAAAGAQAVSVQLDQLRVFYDDLWELHDMLDATIRSMAGEDTFASRHPDAVTSQFTGIAYSWAVTRAAANQNGASLRGNLVGLRSQLRAHLDSLYQTYATYVTADQEGSNELKLAGLGSD